ncbi:MAG: Biopolymer transport protein ExbB [Verrucomicrobiota bacterium]|jgi:biopolymer transport protein TolQ
MSPNDFLSPGLQLGLEHTTLTGWVICGILVVLSIFSWSVMLGKHFLISRAHQANLSFLRAFRNSSHPLALFQKNEHHERSPFDLIYHEAAREMAFYLTGDEEPGDGFSTRLQGAGRVMPSQMRAVQTVMERCVAQAALRLEGRMGTVAMVLTTAPFLGLLGTIWGIMDAFGGLMKATTEGGVAALAPGVSSALVTTIAGLLVAVPSIIGYNHLVNQIRGMIVRLDNFAAELSASLDRSFVDHRFQGDALPSISTFSVPSMPAFGGAATSAIPSPGLR